MDRLAEMLREGSLNIHDHVWKNGMSGWQPIEAVPELLAASKAVPASAANPFESLFSNAAPSFAAPAPMAPQPVAAVSPFPASADDYVVNLHFHMAPTTGIEWLFESIDTDSLKVYLDGRMAGEATYRDGFNFYWQLPPGNHLAEMVLWDRKECDRKKLVLRVPEPGAYQIRFNLVKERKGRIQDSTIDYLQQPPHSGH